MSCARCAGLMVRDIDTEYGLIFSRCIICSHRSDWVELDQPRILEAIPKYIRYIGTEVCSQEICNCGQLARPGKTQCQRCAFRQAQYKIKKRLEAQAERKLKLVPA